MFVSRTDLAPSGESLLGDAAESARTPRVFDFRRPSKFGREHVRVLENAHEVFARRLASGLGSALRGLVQLDPISIDQVSYDDYTRSMPNPNVIAVVDLPPLPGAAVLELNVQLALQLVDRLLGGRGMPVDLRRPTELETYLLRDLMQLGVNAIGETLEPLLEAQPRLGALEFNPQLVQVAAPSDMVLLLSFRVSVSQGVQSEGLLTLCYPSGTLAPVLDKLSSQLAPERRTDGGADDALASALLEAHTRDIGVTVSAQLNASTLTAGDLGALQVGDVIRFDHRVDQPVRGIVGGRDLFTAHLGRRGRRLALQVDDWHLPEQDEGQYRVSLAEQSAPSPSEIPPVV